MRILILAGLILLTFVSCSRYQYITLSSENIPVNENSEFVAETDTLKITYNFNGKNGPVNIAIYNKSDHALEIDWKRSSLIIGERPFPFYQPNQRVTGEIGNTSGSYSGQTINATIQQQEGMEFIPPHSVIYRSGHGVAHNFFNIKSFKATTGKVNVKGFAEEIKKVSFAKDNSPLKFRSYLTLVVEGKTSEVFSVEHSFYLSEVLETKAEPAYVWPENSRKGNKFFLDESTTPGSVVGVIAGTGLIVAVLVTVFNQ